MNFKKTTGSSRATKVGSFSITSVIVVIAIAVVINLLAEAVPTRYTKFDLSPNQMFSISEETKAVIGELDQDITLYWLTRQGSEDYTIGMLLESYEGMSSHIKMVSKDPDVFPTFAQQYTDASITNNSVLIVCEDGTSRYVDYYDLYASDYNYATYYETGVVDYYFVGESAITSAISFLMDDFVPVVYYTKGHGEMDINSGSYSSYVSGLEGQNVELKSLSMSGTNEIPADASALLIFAPANDIAEAEEKMIRGFLSAGGRLIVLTAMQNGSLPRLEGIMADYGVTADHGIVIDPDSSRYAWGTPYYLRPSLSASSDITKALEEADYSVLLPISHGLQVSADLPDGVSVTKLLTTSDKAYAKAAGMGITTFELEEGDTEGKFALAVLITDSNTNGGIVWVAGDALIDETVNSNSSNANLNFFLNTVNYMCGKSETSLQIHSRSLTTEYLDCDEATSTFWSVIFIGVIPAIVLLIGIVVLVRRKRR